VWYVAVLCRGCGAVVGAGRPHSRCLLHHLAGWLQLQGVQALVASPSTLHPVCSVQGVEVWDPSCCSRPVQASHHAAMWDKHTGLPTQASTSGRCMQQGGSVVAGVDSTECDSR
jgi:hypothetical protein